MVPQADIAAIERAGADAPTIDAARRAWAAKFHAGGIDTPELDARLLVGHALGMDHASLAAAGARGLEASEQNTIAALARRRLAREPVARITGIKEFWSLAFRVGPETLVPRPETETVVEAALAAVDARGPRTRAMRMADIGTGCGTLLLALASELPNVFAVGTDLSAAAAALARDNARRFRCTNAVFVACDLTAGLRGPFDLIVCNPPYIATADIAGLAPEVRLFEPRLALDGGSDGLDCYRAIAATVPALLANEGCLIVELGAGLAEPVAAIFAAAGLAALPPRHDLTGASRALVAIKPA